MDLVDEQHVARLEIGEQRREVARALEHRPGGLAQVDAQLVRDDVRQRGLAEARRAEQQHVVERFAAPLRGVDEDAELLADLLLPDVFVEAAGAQRALDDVFLRAGAPGGDDARQLVVLDGHGLASSFSACLMPSATATPSGNCLTAATASRSL